MIRGNWSDRNSDSDAATWIWIIRFWSWLTQVNLDNGRCTNFCCCFCLETMSISQPFLGSLMVCCGTH